MLPAAAAWRISAQRQVVEAFQRRLVIQFEGSLPFIRLLATHHRADLRVLSEFQAPVARPAARHRLLIRLRVLRIGFAVAGVPLGQQA